MAGARRNKFSSTKTRGRQPLSSQKINVASPSPAAIAEGMSYRTLADGGIEVDVGGAVSQPTTIKVLPAAADGKGATAWVVHRGA